MVRAETPSDLRCVVASADILGETPRWCERTQTLWWIDVRRPALQSYEPASGRHIARRLHPALVTGSIALRDAGGFLLATADGLYLQDADTHQPPVRFAHPEEGRPGLRMNDGRCDRRGRFWVGSMHDTQREPLGALWRVDPDLRCTRVFDDVILPNALCWSPDGATMYFADTHRHVVWAFDVDPDDGMPHRRRVFFDSTGQPARPDGATVDAEGHVWLAMVESGQVHRIAPDGRLVRTVQLPVSHATCPAFGGPDLATLYVTSHSQRLTPAQQAREPFAGGLFAFDPGVRGLPEPRFAG